MGATASGAAAPAATYGALLDAVRGLRWPAHRVTRAARSGAHRSRVRGTSAEFTEYRPYRQGDEVRRVDWKLLARTDRAYIRLSDDRSVVPTAVIVDASASMSFPEGPSSRWKVGCALAVALAAVAQQGGDPVGVMVAAEGGAVFAGTPRSRPGTLAGVARALGSATPAGATLLAPALRGAARKAQRLVLLSDFLGDEQETLAAVRELIVTGHEVHAVHLVAADEITPPRSLVLAVDPENRDLRRTLDETARAEYAAAFDAWRTTVAREWARAGARYYMVVPEREALAHAVRRVVLGERAA